MRGLIGRLALAVICGAILACAPIQDHGAPI
jgi:hypothetical protein